MKLSEYEHRRKEDDANDVPDISMTKTSGNPVPEAVLSPTK